MNNLIRIGFLNETTKELHAIKKSIQEVINYQVTFEAGNKQELIRKMKLNSIDLLLINLHISVLNKVQSILEIKSIFPNMKIILMVLYDQPKLFWKYIESGINGIVLKHFNANQILQTVEGVIQQGYYYSESILRSISLFQSKSAQKETVDITGTELEIINGLCNEMTSMEMGQKLFLSNRTIDRHRNEIKKKIGAKSTIGIVKYAIASGLFIV